MYRLVFDERAQSRPPFQTREPLVFIGRDAACQVRLVDNGIGDRHAVIERADDGYYLRDLGTVNGARLNDQLVKLQRLATGDIIELSSVRIKFEIIHEPPPRERAVDVLQLCAVTVVVLVLIGQACLFAWIFSAPRHRGMRIDTGREPRPAEIVPPPVGTPLQPTPPTTATEPTPAPAPAAPAKPETPPVLNKMLRILRVERTEPTNPGNLRIQIRAGVGERDLNVQEIAVSVQFFRQERTSGESRLVPQPVQWLVIPADWENFTARSLSARFAGPAKDFGGFIVTTYYKKQIQDILAEPAKPASSPTHKP